MHQLSESPVPTDSQAIEANRIQAASDLLRTPTQKASSFHQHLLHAKLYAIVQRDDAQLLHSAMEDLRKDWNSERLTQELWYFALLEGKPRTFEALCKFSREKAFKFSLTNALDAMPDAFQMWVLDIPLARNMWLSETEPLSAKAGYQLVNGLKFLEKNHSVKELHALLDKKSEAFHARMRLFIEDFGMQTLMKNGAFLHTIAYYQEPSKKHLRVAATGTQPVYDIARMEAYWPGIGGALVALTGLGLLATECQDKVRKIISNKHASTAPKVEGVELPANFSMV